MKVITFSFLSFVLVALAACSDSSLPEENAGVSKGLAIEVFKSPTCGCCGKWVSHIQENGFDPTIRNRNSLDAIKKKLNIPRELQSCHTGVTAEGYFFEGHIPAKHITAFLANTPEGAIGLAVPGMPAGSPGMEMGDRFTPYEVLLVKADGSTEPFFAVSSLEEQY